MLGISILIFMLLPLLSCEKHPADKQHLVIISMDGLPPAYYLEAEKHGLALPNLRELMSRGVYCDGMQSVYPSLTYPAHASMATGVLPKEHGIYANSYYFDGERRPVVSGNFYQSTPIWRIFRRNGLSSAAVFWPVTVEEPIDWLIPEVWWDADKGNDAVRLQKQLQVSTPGLIDSLRAYIGAPLEKYFESDTVKTDAAIYLLKKYRPNLLLLHYSHFDYLQHLHGKFSPEANATAEMQDKQIGRIVQAARDAGIFERTIFMIVSDHGHADISWQINPGVLLAEAGLLEPASNSTNWRAMIVPAGGACSIILRDTSDANARAAVLNIADSLARHQGIESVFYRAQIDPLGGDPNAEVMFEAKPGYAFGSSSQGELTIPASSKSTHGYLPNKPEMLAGFIAAGPGIAANGNIGYLQSTDLFATIGALFGLQEATEGRTVIEKMLD